MREATIGGLSALDDPRPRKPAAKAGPKAQAAGRASRSARFRRFRTKLAFIVGSAGFSAIMIGIVLNATVMQKGHHPAPLFATPAAPAPALSHPVVADAPATLAAVPAVSAPIAAPPPPAAPAIAAPGAVPLHRVVHAVAPVHPAKAEDGIAKLLGAAHAPPRPAQAARPGATHPAVKPAPTASNHPRASSVAAQAIN